jgi:Heparinase II/III-like protein
MRVTFGRPAGARAPREETIEGVRVRRVAYFASRWKGLASCNHADASSPTLAHRRDALPRRMDSYEIINADSDAEFPLPRIGLIELRDRQRQTELLPYDKLDAAVWPKPAILREQADGIIASGWSIGAYTEISIEPPVVWEGYSRSVAFHLNAWDPVSVLLAAVTVLGDSRYLKAARAAALDWLATFQRPVSSLRTNGELDSTIGRREDFVWYDMAVGQRAYRIAYLLDVSLREDADPATDLELLLDGLYFHLAALARPGFFRAHNNHGIYQALGQWAAARRFEHLPAMVSYRELGESRMEQLYGEHFFASGAHSEHSPGYQRMLLETLAGARSSGLLVGDAWETRFGRMEETLGWMIQPDGQLAMIGDTDPWPPAGGENDHYRDPGLPYLATDVAKGRAPLTGVKAYKDAGYVFMRFLSNGKHEPRHASYLAQQAGFHSRTHKHADHLSFVWCDLGKQVVVDPGRYGYAGFTEPGSQLRAAGFRYSDPNRVYAESTRAHATVEMDELDFPRLGVEPFGSAVVYAAEQQGVAVSECETQPYPNVHHRRILLLCAGEFLLCIDGLMDTTGDLHRFAQRFPLASEWSVQCDGRRARCTHADGATLGIGSLVPGLALEHVSGQREPRMLGWFSDTPGSMIPSPTVTLLAGPHAQCCFATLLSWGDASIEADQQRIDPRLTQAQLTWQSGGRLHELAFVRREGSPFSLSYESSAS